jgi:hypothetical protein
MKSNRFILTMLSVMLALGMVIKGAQVQQPPPAPARTGGAGESASRIVESNLLARMWRSKRQGFGLMRSNSYTNVNGISAGTGSPPAVLGTGTVGKISMWAGISPSGNSTLGDSIITQLNGKIGIGTEAPSSKLTVQGMIETTMGGYKFPDGTVQTTAAVSGLQSVMHNSTLAGDGTAGSPLGISVPLSLSGATNAPASLLAVTNFAVGGNGISGVGGSSDSNVGGIGVFGNGGDSNSGLGGPGLFGRGGNISGGGSPGEGMLALGGNGSSGGGPGVRASGGFSQSGTAGFGADLSGGSSQTGNGGTGARISGGGNNNGTGDGGKGVVALGASSNSGAGGNGVEATGGSTASSLAGVGVVATGGNHTAADVGSKGGNGVEATGGTSNSGFGGNGVVATGGDFNGRGVVATGGIGPAGYGLEATGGPSVGASGVAGAGVFAIGGPSSSPNSASGTAIVALPGNATNGATRGRAGIFQGDVSVEGLLTAGELDVTGTKHFKIDHPLDPENKYLLHASVESSEVLNVYSGNVVTDAKGEAVVTLPDWFEALNRDLRYQLTVIGTFAQVMVANEVKNNRFTIKANAPNIKVSWQVTGVRSDKAMKKQPFKAEENKSERERGHYLQPELFNQPEERGIEWARNPELMKATTKTRSTADRNPKRINSSPYVK